MMVRGIVEAKASGLYKVSWVDNLQWVQPKADHTYDEDFNERPTFVRCTVDDTVYRYRGPNGFQAWAEKHSACGEVA